MSMPKLGSSISAFVPAPALKFGARFLDKALKLKRPWLRTQEYAPIAAAAVAAGLMYTDTYPDEAQGVLDGSLAMVGDELLSMLYTMITKDNPGHSASKGDNPGHNRADNPGRNQRALSEGNAVAEAKRLIDQARTRGADLPMKLRTTIVA